MIAENLAKALGGYRAGSGWMARCPAHKDRKPSLSIRVADNKLLIHCHAGCAQERVISALRARGLWSDHRPRSISRTARRAPIERKPDQEDERHTTIALRIWNTTQTAKNSLVQSYLAQRGITALIPASLRMHLGLRHPSGSRWPAMVALVTRAVDDEPVAIHRTFLAQDGMSKAPVEPAKLMLGPCAGAGAVVRLGGQGQTLLIGEGIETGLSAMQATGHRTWAALSASGLRGLALPDDERDIIVLADADKAGEAAAKDSARRWVREGRRVRIANPPRGMDFNDMLMAFRSGIAFANNSPDEGPASARVKANAADRSSYGGNLPWR
jgi:putative DNA primase/helicase